MMIRRGALVAMTVLAAGPAAAHTGLESSFSVVDGLLHPLGGLDHVAAMVAVGLWSTLAGGRRLLAWPAAFVLAMVAGAAAGYAGFGLPMVESAIAASLVVLGLLIAFAVRAPLAIGALLVALFAIFHGHAHGAEAPAAGWVGYAAGFVLATVGLHGAGIGLGRWLEDAGGATPARGIGVATAVLGVILLAR